jgi:hypothetical protein
MSQFRIRRAFAVDPSDDTSKLGFGFSIDGANEKFVFTKLPTSQPLNPFVAMDNVTSGTKNFLIDYFELNRLRRDLY